MDEAARALIEQMESKDLAALDLKFTDLFGGWHHLTVPAKALQEELFRSGYGFDSSSMPGFKTVEAGDMILLPDPTSWFIDPFWQEPTLSFFCNIVEADTRVQFHRDPRCVARKAEEYLRSTGIATESRWAPEFEYYTFDEVRMVQQPQKSYCEFVSQEAAWGTDVDFPDSPNAIQQGGGYHIIQPRDLYCDMREETVQMLEACGIDIHYHHHEVGPSGQVEIEVKRYPLLRMGDHAMTIKYFIRMVAHAHGKTITFMPKPLFRQPGNGMHFHQHLFRDGQPLFYDRDAYGGLSRLGRSYVAGILAHAPALLGLTNPSTNSYKRLVPGFEAPMYSFFALANRTAAIRIPKYATDPMEKRIEFRPPDATCNVYLAMAAMLMAGIDGIQKNMDPEKLGFGPFDVNIFSLPEEKRKQIGHLPSSLIEALDELEKDHAFLLAGGVFTEDLIAAWIEGKKKEHYEVIQRPHPLEISMYYNA